MTVPIPQARVWRQPPIARRRMASMLTGPIGAVAAKAIQNAAEGMWGSETNTMLRQIG